MTKFLLLLLSAPLGYLLLTGYLISKVKPAPLTIVPRSRVEEDRRLAAAIAA